MYASCVPTLAPTLSMAAPPTTATIADAVLQIQHALLDSASLSEQHLFSAASLFSHADYEDVVEELSIAGICGYPLCRNTLPSDCQGRGRYRISLREHRVYDLAETYKYCSEGCVISSRAFSATLGGERSSDLSASKIEEILALFRCLESSPMDSGKHGDLGIDKLTIRDKDDAGKGEVSLDEWLGPSNAIEGYVPQDDRSHVEARRNWNTKKAKDDTNGDLDFASSITHLSERDGLTYSTFGTVDASEAIARMLEEVVLEERRPKTTKAASKSLKPKTTENLHIDRRGDLKFRTGNTVVGESSAASQKPLEKDFASTSHVANEVSETSLTAAKKPLPTLENGIHVENGTGPEEAVHKSGNMVSSNKERVLKSSLKTSRSKNAGLSVKWADESENLARDGKETCLKNSKRPKDSEVEDDSSLRLTSAEACVAALTEAAEAVASGISEPGHAALEAGIVILPQPYCVNEMDIDEDEDAFEFDKGYVKWPKKTVLLDTDIFEVEDSWHDTPPEGFSLKLSSFSSMWMALFGWITCSSMAYIYGCDESSQEDFLTVNGREYPHKIVLKDGQSSEIRRTIDGYVCRALPGLVMELRIRVPISTLEKTLGRLLDTMSFVEALPPFKLKLWQVIVLLFMDAVSVHRLPSLAPHFANMDLLLNKVLNPAQVTQEEYEYMRDLVLPLGRSYDISIRTSGS